MYLDYQSFINCIIELLNEQTEEGTWIEIGHQLRNNGVNHDSFVFRRQNEPIAPSIPAACFYEAYQKGSSVNEIVREIRSCYEAGKPGREVDLSFLTDAGALRRNTVCRLINHEYNKELLEQVPHRIFLNLAVVYYYILEDPEIGNGSILLRSDQLGMLGISAQELDLCARRNTRKRCPVSFGTLKSVMDEMLGKTEPAEGEKGEEKTILWDGEGKNRQEVPLYILTNKERFYGAYWMSDPDVQRMIAERIGGAYYVLPSSVHECMIVPEYIAWDCASLAEMVAEINRECVPKEEVLADSIYYYSEKDKNLTLFSYDVDN